jgi:hypothetical protein
VELKTLVEFDTSVACAGEVGGLLDTALDEYGEFVWPLKFLKAFFVGPP